MGRSVEDFYRDLEKHTHHGKILPAWYEFCVICITTSDGETGTASFTWSSTVARTHLTVSVPSISPVPSWNQFAGSIKKGNRKSEILLRDVEVHPQRLHDEDL
jgi:hypothetical protein